MRRHAHPWGTPPWTISFRPARRPLPPRVDFAVVGAGFAGLSAAAHLAKLAPNKSVLILESGYIGNGASGRNGGMALAATAVGPLPGIGDVLAGYKKILRALQVDSHLHLPGAYELSRSSKRKNSPIHWSDSGDLRVSKQVPGGTIDPGRVVSGLARAAQKSGAQIVEHAELLSVEAAHPHANRRSRPDSHAANAPLKLRIRLNAGKHTRLKTLLAHQVLLATNSGSLQLAGLQTFSEPKLTLALATAPLTKSQLRAAGLSARHPFYTVDLPYLWGRLLENNGVIFGAGLVPAPKSFRSIFSAGFAKHRPNNAFHDLLRFDIRDGAAADRLRWLESRVRKIHPVFKNIRVTRRWGGPILITKTFRPVFRRHPRNKRVLILAGFSGHGVALSVYLGRWAAQSLLKLRPLPHWPA